MQQPAWSTGQHHHPFRKKESLVHVVGDQQHGFFVVAPNGKQQPLQAAAGNRIQGAEGFVQQQHRPVAEQRADQGRALAHPSGELGGVMALEAIQAEFNQQPGGQLLFFPVFAPGTQFGRQQNIVPQRPPGKEQVVLLHIGR